MCKKNCSFDNISFPVKMMYEKWYKKHEHYRLLFMYLALWSHFRELWITSPRGIKILKLTVSIFLCFYFILFYFQLFSIYPNLIHNISFINAYSWCTEGKWTVTRAVWGFIKIFEKVVIHKVLTQRQDDERRIVISIISVSLSKWSIKNDIRCTL